MIHVNQVTVQVCPSSVFDSALHVQHARMKSAGGFRTARTRSTPPKAADLAALRRPVRSCSTPPVAAPAMMEFQGSSWVREQHTQLRRML